MASLVELNIGKERHALFETDVTTVTFNEPHKEDVSTPSRFIDVSFFFFKFVWEIYYGQFGIYSARYVLGYPIQCDMLYICFFFLNENCWGLRHTKKGLFFMIRELWGHVNFWIDILSTRVAWDGVIFYTTVKPLWSRHKLIRIRVSIFGWGRERGICFLFFFFFDTAAVSNCKFRKEKSSARIEKFTSTTAATRVGVVLMSQLRHCWTSF